ncbi:MAG TPA: M4 family metallopeptidase, partial [Bacteroidales bacterium]|nr:M4 family metallopeptidase [Bacteroidales bacterium]
MTRFVTLIFAFLFFLSGFGQSDRLVYKGEQARALIRGASEIVFDTRGQRPEYISFGKGWLMEQQDFPALLPGVMGLGKDYSLTLQGTALQDKDAIHQRLRMAYQGTPVEDGMWVAHLRQGELYALNGNLYRSILPLNQVVLTAKAARTLALQTVGALSYRWEDEGEEAHLRRETGNPSASYFPQGELILSPYLSDEVQGHRYAWKFRIYASKPLALREVLIDASNGEVIRNLDLLSAIDAPGLAVTKYSGNQEIMADSTATGYRLRETGRGNGIETYNMLTGTNYASAVDFTDSDNYWNNFNTAKDEVATDAHWGAEMTYDYFLDVHGRNSIDDNGFTLRSYVHYDVAYANAFWDGYRMTYGDGNGSINPLVALDIVAHEISHGVTTYTADLVYAYEPGAMNEAFSDIFGTAVEFFAKPAAANWTIGENLGGAFRSMSNPNAYGDPDTYLGNNWYSGSNDNGGVHTNSGVLNHWFYLLSVGGNGINDLGNAYSVTGLGILDASRVAYRMLSVYLTNTSQYADARFYGIKSAIDLFGPCTPAVASVTNAFHAVGIGAPYYNGVLADFDASATAFCTVPAQVKFSNNTVNGITYLWDFGDGNSSASAEPVHYYSQAGAFNVQLIADGGVCGSDTLVKAALVHVNPPAPPQVQHAQSCGPDSLVLIAVGTDSIHWYAPGNQFLAKGDTFSTPLLNQSATYYAYNVLESPPVFGAKPNNSGGGGYFSASNSHHLEFNATDAVILRSVKVYASTSGYRTISLEDASGTTLAAMSINIPSGE